MNTFIIKLFYANLTSQMKRFASTFSAIIFLLSKHCSCLMSIKGDHEKKNAKRLKADLKVVTIYRPK